jgi:hypothetical protein
VLQLDPNLNAPSGKIEHYSQVFVVLSANKDPVQLPESMQLRVVVAVGAEYSFLSSLFAMH